jgi:hypothetical protein
MDKPLAVARSLGSFLIDMSADVLRVGWLEVLERKVSTQLMR